MTDAERIDWLQEKHTLHKSVQFLYVVDGYETHVMADSSDVPLAVYAGRSLRESIDAAMRGEPERDRWGRAILPTNPTKGRR